MAAILNLRCESCQPFSLKIHHCFVHHWSFTLLDIKKPTHLVINVKKAYTAVNFSMGEPPTCGGYVRVGVRVNFTVRLRLRLGLGFGLRFGFCHGEFLSWRAFFTSSHSF